MVLVGRDLSDCFLGTVLRAVAVVYVHFCVVGHAHSVLHVVYYVTVFGEHFVRYCALFLRGGTLEAIS